MSRAPLDRFAVDADELAAVVDDIDACDRELGWLTDELDRCVAALQEGWGGLAAEAQRGAHQRWRAGMVEMNHALAGLRAAARRAHGNYAGAAEGNARLWEGLG